MEKRFQAFAFKCNLHRYYTETTADDGDAVAERKRLLYMSHFRRVHALLSGKRKLAPMMWDDHVRSHPQSLSELPKVGLYKFNPVDPTAGDLIFDLISWFQILL